MLSMWFNVFLTLLASFRLNGVSAVFIAPADKQDFGYKQSPININTSATLIKALSPLIFNSAYSDKVPFYLMSYENTIVGKIKYDYYRPSFYYENNPSYTYVFHQFHFHWGSEHMLNGKRYPLEMHFVHYNTKYENYEKAAEYEDGIIVMSVLYSYYGLKNLDTETMLDAVREKLLDGHAENRKENFEPEDADMVYLRLRYLLPIDSNTYYYYNGSFTTAPYYESVFWIVYDQYHYVSEAMIQSFHTLKGIDRRPVLENYRQVQPLYSRKVYRTYTIRQRDEADITITDP